METCPSCKGTKKVTIKVISNGVREPDMELDCVTCNGTGEVRDGYTKALEDFWCHCGNPSGDVEFHDDGEGAACSKHHYTCGDCGRVLQIG